MPLNGVIVVDKPAGWTSHDVVAKARRILGERSIGHLGTLDPMATGVLPLVVGRMTRLCQFYSSSEKAYQGTIRLGVATDTYDGDGDPVGPAQDVNVTLEEIRAVVSGFVGFIQQTPPSFSAKKIKGVPAYKLARKKQEVELKPVEVEVKEFTVLGLNGDLVDFRCRVSSGTYVRSLAHELGQKLGIGAHLASLRRTAVAEFAIEEVDELLAEGREQGYLPSGHVRDVLAEVELSLDQIDTLFGGKVLVQILIVQLVLYKVLGSDYFTNIMVISSHSCEQRISAYPFSSSFC